LLASSFTNDDNNNNNNDDHNNTSNNDNNKYAYASHAYAGNIGRWNECPRGVITESIMTRLHNSPLSCV
jgi:hypothetical protein